MIALLCMRDYSLCKCIVPLPHSLLHQWQIVSRVGGGEEGEGEREPGESVPDSQTNKTLRGTYMHGHPCMLSVFEDTNQ